MKKTIALIVILSAIVAVFFTFRENFTRENIEAFRQGVGPWGPAVFILIYLVAPAFFLPGFPLTIASGVLFGPVWGTVYSIVGATGGATLAFVIGRYLGREWVEKKVSGGLKAVKEGVEEEGWRFLAFTRLVPIFPFNLLNYAFGLTRIPLLQYVVISFICMLPATAVYSYLGYAGREALTSGSKVVLLAQIAIGLLILRSMIPRLVRKARG